MLPSSSHALYKASQMPESPSAHMLAQTASRHCCTAMLGVQKQPLALCLHLCGPPRSRRSSSSMPCWNGWLKQVSMLLQQQCYVNAGVMLSISAMGAAGPHCTVLVETQVAACHNVRLPINRICLNWHKPYVKRKQLSVCLLGRLSVCLSVCLSTAWSVNNMYSNLV